MNFIINPYNWQVRIVKNRERHNVAKRDSMSRNGAVSGMAWHLLDLGRRYRI